MRRITAAVLCLLFLCSMFVGCYDNEEKAEELKELKIGVSVYNQYDTFISEYVDLMRSYAEGMEEKYGVTVTLDVQDAGGSQINQNDQMDYFIDRNCDIVCINLVDRTDASAIIERGKSADIPIIFFNRELVEEDLERWDKLYYVGANAFESGIIQGEILIDRLKEDFDSVDLNGDGILQYVILEGEVGHQDTILRTMYTIDTVTEAGYEVEKLADEIANWNRDQGKTKMEQWMREFDTQIEVVFSNNDDMALGAVDALKEAGYYEDSTKQPPVVLGVDGVKAALEAVDDGYLLGTVINDSKGQSKGIMELAYSLATGNELSSEITLLDNKYIHMPYQKRVKEEK